jgi:hypothetical protein
VNKIVASVHQPQGLETSFTAEVVVVERVSRGRVGGDTLGVGGVGPTELGGTVGAVKELPGGFVEVVAVLVGNDEFDRCGTPALYISYMLPTVIICFVVR